MGMDGLLVGMPLERQWRRLYAAARRFRAAKPWKLLGDSDLVAVTDPSTGRELYCSVQEESAYSGGLMAYRGARGLDYYFGILSDGLDERLARYQLDCLALRFGNKAALGDEERTLVTALDLCYRGRHAWPRFRAHVPGRVPWYLSPSEIITLTVCIEQVLALVADEGGAMMLESPDGEMVVPRRYRYVNSEGLHWHTDLMPLELPCGEEVVEMELDEGAQRSLARARIEPGLCWDVALIDLPTPATDEVPPYYPLLPAVADSETGRVFQTDLVRRGPHELEHACRLIVAALLDCERRPETLQVSDERLMVALLPLYVLAGIELSLVYHQPAIEELRNTLDTLAASR